MSRKQEDPNKTRFWGDRVVSAIPGLVAAGAAGTLAQRGAMRKAMRNSSGMDPITGAIHVAKKGAAAAGLASAGTSIGINQAMANKHFNDIAGRDATPGERASMAAKNMIAGSWSNSKTNALRAAREDARKTNRQEKKACYSEALFEKVASDLRVRDTLKHINGEVSTGKAMVDQLKSEGKGLAIGGVSGAGLGAIAAPLLFHQPSSQGAKIGGVLGAGLGATAGAFNGQNKHAKKITEATKNYFRSQGVSDEDIEEMINSRIIPSKLLQGKHLAAVSAKEMNKYLANKEKKACYIEAIFEKVAEELY
ncbi:MAG: hypothetical protein RR420_00800 [Anaerovoracaceae bacterium]